MNIRLATSADIPRMSEVYRAAFLEVAADERWTPESAARLINFFLASQPDLAFVAESG